MGLRPERLSVVRGPATDRLGGELILAEHLGDETILHLAGPQGVMIVKCDGDFAAKLGARIEITMDLAGANLFDAEGRALSTAWPDGDERERGCL